MTFFTRRKNSTNALSEDGSTQESSSPKKSSVLKSMRGNIFFALFAAVGMVGAVGYGFNTVIRGPITSMSDVTRRTVTENYVITASRVAIVNATTQQANNGDCDDDGMIEPLPYRDPAGAPAPIGGGLIPLDLVPDTVDPWNTGYGYCAWDAGSLSVSDAVAGCGGGTPRRLQGSPHNNQYSIAIISAGKDKKFDTRCNAYVDTTPADNLPDTPLLVKTAGSDDIVLAYTYAEANDLGNGLWKEKAADPTTLQTDKNVESTGGATFADAVVLTGNTITGGGLVLPGDPGDDSLSGPCNAANERQLRLNTSTTPPTMEICDYNGGAGLGWVAVSGTGGPAGGPADCSGLGDGHYNDATTGHCYYRDDHAVPLSFSQSQSECAANGGYLAVVSSSAENTLIFSNLVNGQGINYLGGRAAVDGSGEWRWEGGELNGQLFSMAAVAQNGLYTNWEGGEPGEVGESCLQMGWAPAGAWDDYTCSADGARNGHICEITGTPAGGGGGPTGPADCSGLGDQSYNDPITGHCYYYNSSNETYIDSQSSCASNGAYLAAPSSAEEDAIIMGLIGGDDVWFGISDSATEGQWVYSYGELAGTPFWSGNAGGSPVSGRYSNWEAAQPDNWTGGPEGAENCAVYSNTGTEWNDVGCDAPSGVYASVCEKTGTPQGNPPPVSRWKLNESAGATAVDALGAHNGTVTGSTTWQPSGGVNAGALQFNAGGGKIEVPRTTALEPQAISISAWVKRNGAQPQYAMIITKGWQGNSPPTYHSYSLQFNDDDDDTVGFVTGSSGGGDFLTSTAGVIPDNTWVHVMGTFDPNGSAPQKKLYINGVLNASATITDALIYDSGSDADLSFGDDEANGAKFVGSLDDIRVYDRALTQEQIQTIYEATSAPPMQLRSLNKPGKLFGSGLDTNGAQGNGTGALNVNSFYALPVGDDFVSVSTGSGSSCAVKSDGTLWCWGDDTYGQLGDGGTNTHAQVMTQISGVTDAIKAQIYILGGCYLRASGQLMCWGDNTGGVLGTGSATPASSATAIAASAGPNDYVDFAISKYSGAIASTVCALRTNGSVVCWGEGSNGELGNGANSDSLTPVPVSNVTNFVQIVSTSNTLGTGGRFCGLTTTGAAYCWGRELADEFGNGGSNNGIYNVPTLVSTFSDWAKITAGDRYTCGIRANGQAYCWGSDSTSQLGDGGAATNMVVPTATNTSARFRDIFAGYSSTCAITTTRDLYCWGSNASGQLGGGPGMASTLGSPARTNGRNVIHASIGAGVVFMIMDETATDAVAANKMPNLVGSGYFFGCAVMKDGNIVCWGDDTNGELGNGATTGFQTSPTAITEPGPWMQVSVGARMQNGTACAIKGDGTAWCWGEGSEGQIGNGASADVTVPTRVSGGASRQWSQISVGGDTNAGYTCGIETDGDLYCWGFGIGNTPTLMSFGKTWTKISSGQNSACGIANDGEIYCWGADTYGELGNGPAVTATQTVPGGIQSGGPWVDVATGPITCGIKANGSLWCWGNLTAASITGWDNTTPQLMMDIGPWTKVETNLENVCAIKANGSLWCFGEGGAYMNGTGVTTDYSYPQPVLGGGQYIDVSVGYDNVCGLRSDYSVYCWGGVVQKPLRTEIVTNRSGWEWDATDTALKPAPGLSPMIGTSRWISDDGAANKGLNMGTTGRSQLRQSVANQLFVEGKGEGLDAQATLRAASAVAGDVQEGLIRHFKLDETTGSTIVDTEGGGNGTWADGSGNSVAQETRAGINGGALHFDGTDDRISISNFTPPASGTVAMWVSFDDLAENRFFGGNTDFEILLWDSTDFIESDIGGSSGPTTGPAAVNTWYHIVVTYNAASSSLYLDGVLKATAATPVIPAGPFTLYIGDSDSGANHDGMIDDVRIYDRVLDPGEIQQLYNFTQTNVITRSMGVDAATGNFEIARNNSTATGWLSYINPDIEISKSGNVGIGTTGAPASKLDVNGAIRVGNEATCDGAAEGTIRWTGTEMQYCDGTWQPLVSANTGGGGGGGGASTTGTWMSLGDGDTMIRADGSAFMFGDATDGRLGNDQDATPAYTDSLAQVMSSAPPATWSDWLTLGSGATSCGLRVNGTAWCWGFDGAGQLGTDTYSNRNIPNQVEKTDGSAGWSDWVFVKGTTWVPCGIRANGTAYCWGYAGEAALGNGQTSTDADTPQPVHSSTNPYTPWTDWKFLETSAYTAAGFRANGEAYAWGMDNAGLGTDSTVNGAAQPRPGLIMGVGGAAAYTDWKDISVTEEGICGIRANGQMYCIGSGRSGRLGNTSTSDSAWPVLVRDTDCSAGGDHYWRDVSASYASTCAVKSDGTMWCWGDATLGQGGNNDLDGHNNSGENMCMVQVLDDTGGAGWTDWVSVSGTCGQRANGTIWCWGPGGGPGGANAPLPVMVEAP